MDFVQELATNFASPIASVICAGVVILANLRSQSVMPAIRIIIGNKTNWELREKIERKVDESERKTNKRLNDVQNELARGINQAQVLAAGAPLMTVEDPAKRVLLQARLKAFATNIRNGGEDERVNCKGPIDSNLFTNADGH